MIRNCTCSHSYQDQVHGPGKRVMNKTSNPEGYRCTACGRQDSLSKPKKAAKKEE